MITRRQDGGPADLPFWLWFGALVTLGLLFTALYLDKQATLVPADPPPTTNQVEELHRQLDDLQRQSDELGRRIQEDIQMLQLRQRMIERAEAAGTDPYWVDYAWNRSADAGVNPSMAVGVIDTESGWYMYAANENDDYSIDSGLGQTNSKTLEFAASLAGIQNPNPYDPKDSIDMTVAYLAYLQRTVGPDPDRVLTAYNRGEGGLQTWLTSRGTARSPYSTAVLEGVR